MLPPIDHKGDDDDYVLVRAEDVAPSAFRQFGDAFTYLAQLLHETAVRVPRRLLIDEPLPEPVQPPAPAVHEKRIVVFDTETSGLNPPLVIELAYVVLNYESLEEVSHSSQLLSLPVGQSISYGAFKVHGISDAAVRKRGVPAVAALRTFTDLCHEIVADGGLVVAHNAAFDARAINATFQAFLAPNRFSVQTFCTMRSATAFCGLQGKAGRPKPPKNEELYKILFKQAPNQKLHSALGDVRVSVDNYRGLRARKLAP